ncbi:MAG: hypothetical protein R3E97_04805 [Candidatus Eisenbacteria bacterium]
MRRLTFALVSAASILSIAGAAHAECGSIEGTITWKSGLDISHYSPGEGFEGFFLEVASSGGLVTATDFYGLRCFRDRRARTARSQDTASPSATAPAS